MAKPAEIEGRWVSFLAGITYPSSSLGLLEYLVDSLRSVGGFVIVYHPQLYPGLTGSYFSCCSAQNIIPNLSFYSEFV